MDLNLWLLVTAGLVTKVYGNDVIVQWVNSVRAYSSAYSATSWSPQQIVGPQDTFSYGDIPTAYIPGPNANCVDEWIEITYTTPAFLDELVIVETYNGGGVMSVMAETSSGWETVYTRNPADPRQTAVRLYSPQLSWIPLEKVSVFRININCCAISCAGWTEIDAVQFIGLNNRILSFSYETLIGSQQRLLGHVVGEHVVRSAVECGNTCSNVPDVCKSFNFHEASGACELNGAVTPEQEAAGTSQEAGWAYYTLV